MSKRVHNSKGRKSRFKGTNRRGHFSGRRVDYSVRRHITLAGENALPFDWSGFVNNLRGRA
jgi:hypothetical protein